MDFENVLLGVLFIAYNNNVSKNSNISSMLRIPQRSDV